MKISNSLIAGTAGALTLNLLHEGTRQFRSDAPRVDLLGKQMMLRAFRRSHKKAPKGKNLYWSTLVVDLISNALYYSLIGWGKGKNAWVRGLLLGMSGGLGALRLPPLVKLSRRKVARRKTTRWMTLAWYTLGGIAAGGLGRWLSRHA